MTITLRPETAQAVAEAARQHGMTVDQWVDERLQTSSPPAQTAAVSQSALRDQVKAAHGKFAHVTGGSAAFMRNKADEKLLEYPPPCAAHRFPPKGGTRNAHPHGTHS